MSKVIYDSQLNAEPYELWGNETRGKVSTFNPNYSNEGRNYQEKSTPTTDVYGGDRVKSYEYPLNKKNDHFVRFSINLTEESRLIKRGQVGVIGNADNSNQNRLNNNTISQQSGGGAIVGSIAATIAPVAIGAAAAPVAALVSRMGLIRAAGVGLGVYGANAAGEFDGASEFMTNSAGELSSYVGKAVDEVFAFTNKLKKLAAQVILYTPSSVRVQYGMNYEILDNNLIAILMQDKNFESLKSGLTNPSTYGESALKIAKTALGAGTELGSLLTRTAINRRKDVKFNSVDNRSFTFDYVFAPQNAEEAKEVAGIIFMFKYFAHPELIDGYMNFMYTYPAEFDIEYGIRSKEDTVIGETMNPNLNRISSCALTNIVIDYSPNGSFQTLEQGEPCFVAMSLQFQEIETLHRDKIGMGY